MPPDHGEGPEVGKAVGLVVFGGRREEGGYVTEHQGMGR